MHERSPTLLQETINYVFKDQNLLKAALLHKSAAPHKQISSFERYEFLGDRVLGLVISAHLLKAYPENTERDLALHFAHLTQKKTLVSIAQTLNLANYIHMAKMPTAIAKETEKIQADGLEALLGAIFMDGGLTPSRRLILKLWKPYFQTHAKKDPKSILQEWTQKHHGTLPRYSLIKQTGPAHRPTIEISVHIQSDNHSMTASANARSRKIAETKAAEKMLHILKNQESLC